MGLGRRLPLSLLLFPISNLIASSLHRGCLDGVVLLTSATHASCEQKEIITMLRCWLVILAAMVWCANGWAQSSDRVEVFGGYSYVARDFSSGTIGNGGLKLGWNASLNLKVGRLLGFVSDFGGHYNHQNSGGVCAGGMASCSSSGYTAMLALRSPFPCRK
jgi:hypothetical protein